MKKIFFALAAMAAVFASCQKAEISDPSSNEIKLNVTVAELGDPATKALIKTGWEDGDLISLWLDSNTSANPNYVIKYNGTESKWEQDKSATTESVTPGSSGSVKALYNGQVKVVSKDSYTCSGNTLSFSIATWTFLTEIQVVVTGITYEAGKTYTLACDHLKPLSGDGYTVEAGAISASTGTAGTAVNGISNTDGVAFVFATSDSYGSSADYKFTFNNAGSTRTYTASSKNLTSSASSINGLKIASGQFSSATTGTAKAKLDGTNEVDVPWVQLWENGPKFATINVGVTSTSATGTDLYGGLYRWGGTNNMRSNTSASDDHNDGSADLTHTGDDPTDTATKLWGSNWKMPNQTDLVSLKSTDNCVWTWCDGTTVQYVSGCTLAGWKVSGKTGTDYANNSIFLPAAGYFNYGNNTVSSAGSYGFYWSSTPYGSNYAYELYFLSDDQVVYLSNRKYGYSVRAVLVD